MTAGMANKHTGALIFAAGPTLLFFFAQASMSLADLFFFARLPSAMAITALAFMGPSVLILSCLGTVAVALATSTHRHFDFAQRFGQEQNLYAISFNALLLTSIFAVVACSGGWWAIEPIFEVITDHRAVIDAGVLYTTIRLLALPAFAGFVLLWGIVDATESAMSHLWVLLLMITVNIGLNALLISGVGPFPPLGIEGAALATVVATVLALVALAVSVLGSKNCIGARFWRPSNFCARRCRDLIRSAALPAATWSMAIIGVLALFRLVAMSDQHALDAAIDAAAHPQGISTILPEWILSSSTWAAYPYVVDWPQAMASSRPPIFSAASSLVLVFLSVVVAASFGAARWSQIFVGRAGHTEDFDGADTKCWELISLLMVLTGAVAIAILVVPRLWLALFSPDITVTTTAVPVLRLMGAQLPLIAMTVVLCGGYLGSRRSWIAAGTVTLCAAVTAALAYLPTLVFSVEFMGIWWAAASLITVSTLFLAVTFWLGIWKPREN